jgi:hypothetical protein
VLMQTKYVITFERKKTNETPTKMANSWKKMFIITSYLKTWQHYLRLQKVKGFMDNVSLRYFEMQSRAITK